MKWIGGIVLGGLCVAAVACSSSSSSSGVSSGVDGSKTGESITKEEAKKICESRNSYASSKVSADLACRSAGFTAAGIANAFGTAKTDAEIQKACQDVVDECAKPQDGGETTDPCASAAPVDGCTAAVSDLEACMTAQIDASVKVLESVPACGSLTADSFKSTGEVEKPEQPAACDGIPAACGLGTIDGGNGAGGDGGGAG